MKQLPIVFPLIETYQGASFVMGIILADSRLKNLIYNEYIHMSALPSTRLLDLDYICDRVLWDGLEKYGIEMDLYNSKNQSKDFFCSFLEERLDQDCYLLFYNINEFYLSHTSNYKKRNLIHDIYVYGYTDRTFLVMGYKDKKLQMFELPKQEIVDAFYEITEEENKNFCTMRISRVSNVSIDYPAIYNHIKDYYWNCSAYEDGRVHGVEVNQLILLCLNKLVESENICEIDLRPFRLIYEHKKLMAIRIRKIAEAYPIHDSIGLSEELQKMAKKLFMLSIKYNMVFSKGIIEKMIGLLEEINASEMQFAKTLFNEWHIV